MNCIICNKEIDPNEYIVVASIKNHEFICGDCAINNWHYYEYEENDIDDYEPWGDDPDEDYLDFMDYCDDVWEQNYGPDVPLCCYCSICNKSIDEADSSLIFTRTYNKEEKFYHEECLKWPLNYYDEQDFRGNFEEFYDCKNNKEAIKLIREGFIQPYKLKEVI